MPKHEIENNYKLSLKNKSKIPVGKNQDRIQEVVWCGDSDTR